MPVPSFPPFTHSENFLRVRNTRQQELDRLDSSVVEQLHGPVIDELSVGQPRLERLIADRIQEKISHLITDRDVRLTLENLQRTGWVKPTNRRSHGFEHKPAYWHLLEHHNCMALVTTGSEMHKKDWGTYRTQECGLCGDIWIFNPAMPEAGWVRLTEEEPESEPVLT